MLLEDVQVTDLRGRIGGLRVGWMIDENNLVRSREFLKANHAGYESTDWALDISEAQFSCVMDFAGIPARLVRRNNVDQFVMTRGGASRLASEPEPLLWNICATRFLELGFPDRVIVVGGRSTGAKKNLRDAYRLGDRGLLL